MDGYCTIHVKEKLMRLKNQSKQNGSSDILLTTYRIVSDSRFARIKPSAIKNPSDSEPSSFSPSPTTSKNAPLFSLSESLGQAGSAPSSIRRLDCSTALTKHSSPSLFTTSKGNQGTNFSLKILRRFLTLFLQHSKHSQLKVT